MNSSERIKCTHLHVCIRGTSLKHTDGVKSTCRNEGIKRCHRSHSSANKLLISKNKIEREDVRIVAVSLDHLSRFIFFFFGGGASFESPRSQRGREMSWQANQDG